MELTIANFIGKPIAVLDIDGRKVYEQLMEAYKRHEKVVLSFKGLQHVTTAFLNAALGRFLIGAPEATDMIAIEGLENESTKNKIDQVYQLALNPELRQIRENARNQELGIDG